jgi:hypothetical protein
MEGKIITAGQGAGEEESMPEWPLERRARQNRATQRAPFVVVISDGTLNEESSQPTFDVLVEAILKAYDVRSGPESALSHLRELVRSLVGQDAGEASAESFDTRLVQACIEALRRVPTADTWEFLWSLAWHSASLKHGIRSAVVAAAAGDPSFKSSFLSIASDVVKNAANNPGRRAIPRERAHAKRLREDWREKPTLTRLWWSHFERDASVLFRDDDGVLSIVADLDLIAFVELLSLFDNPYPVVAALDAARARWSFSRWQALVSVAPVAFDDDGRWNGSAIPPPPFVPRPGSDPSTSSPTLPYHPGRSTERDCGGDWWISPRDGKCCRSSPRRRPVCQTMGDLADAPGNDKSLERAVAVPNRCAVTRLYRYRAD